MSIERTAPPREYYSSWPRGKPLTDRDPWWRAFTEIRHRPLRAWKLAPHRRERIIDAAVALMRGAESPFNVEGPWLAGVRAALCLERWPWAEAHDEAHQITTEALARCGCAERPTWDEGQRVIDGFNPYALTRCALCDGPLADDRRTGSVYCSDRCRTVSKQRRDRARMSMLARVEAVARQMTHRASGAAALLDCEHCGREFDAKHKWFRMRFCSVACADAGKARRQSEIEPVRCVQCGESFRPRGKRPRKYCGSACYRAAQTLDVRGVEATCPVCATIFRVHSAALRQKCCSRRCAGFLRQRGASEVRTSPPKPHSATEGLARAAA